MKKGGSPASGLKSGYRVGSLRQWDSPPSHLSAFMERHGNPGGSAVNRHQDLGFTGRQVHRFDGDREIVGKLCERNALPGRTEFQGHEC